jgi:hypothetical protein
LNHALVVFLNILGSVVAHFHNTISLFMVLSAVWRKVSFLARGHLITISTRYGIQYAEVTIVDISHENCCSGLLFSSTDTESHMLDPAFS